MNLMKWSRTIAIFADKTPGWKKALNICFPPKGLIYYNQVARPLWHVFTVSLTVLASVVHCISQIILIIILIINILPPYDSHFQQMIRWLRCACYSLKLKVRGAQFFTFHKFIPCSQNKKCLNALKVKCQCFKDCGVSVIKDLRSWPSLHLAYGDGGNETTK